MQQFDKVLKELRIWLMSFSIVNKLIPYGVYIMFGSLACLLLDEILITYFTIISIISAIGYYGFLVGFWLVLISNEIKWAPYGLFCRAFIVLFPFTGFYLFTTISASIYIYFGYYLLKYTALKSECH
ncbi:hypothetical protein [Paramaledivibacter caminithermalis]|uniref:Uncharacterized protein n=1 Tax=Paramaledivibacter caminithermalis (strain DSM 15212 / CIP 107654 / DViRD3) TaxID=1121301 RepID=A0A1M6N1T0_PARC5|nr:hypothetical protein [Paramaledivibacter caminithermalis]SHJ89645.1 hypothetical protein SAMN02745912_01533 [Paramaledivibacter caminithermalis DSM 15212]